MINRTQSTAAAGRRRTLNHCPVLVAGLGWLAFLFFASATVPAAFAAGPSASSLFKHGQAAEARQDWDTAYDDYQKAYQKNPKDVRYQTAYYRVRISASSAHVSQGRKLFQAGDIQGALAEFLHASEIDPGNEEAGQEIARVREKQGQVAPSSEAAIPELEGEQAELDSIGSPAHLKPISTEPLTLHMTEDTKVIYQAVGKAAGINILFDPDFNSKRISVELTSVSLLDALRIVGTMSNTFWRPVTSNTIFVATNSRAKRTELDEQAVQTFYLANAWQQNDLNDVQTAIRNLMPQTKVYAVQSQNAIVMRGTPDELLLAQQLVSDLDKPRPEVVVDMAVMEVSRNWERTLGIEWPSSFGVALTPPCSSGSCSSSSSTSGTTSTTTSSTTSPTLYDLSHLKASDFAVTIGSATLNLLLTDADTQILQDPRIRATDGQKASMKIGSKIPIATGSYQTGAATALVSSLVNTQFQYEDVGVDVEMTPSVHYDNDVTLKVKITVSAQSGSVTISGVTEPILSQRVVDQVIRLHEGEASILGGIQNNQDQQSWTGIPGLSSIPILKYLFGSKDHTVQNDEIVFVVVPHIVRSADIQQRNLRQIDTGTGQSIDLRHLDFDGNAAQPPAPAVRPTALDQQPGQQEAGPQPGQRPQFTGTIPSQSADIAAPIALAQMRSNLQQSVAPAAQRMQQTEQATALPNTLGAAQPVAPQPAAQPANQMPSPSQAQATGQSAPTTAPIIRAPGAPPISGPITAPPLPGAAVPGRPSGPAAFSFNPPPGSLSSGATFQVPVTVNGAADASLIPLQIHFDPAVLSLVNVTAGNLLNRDGQPATIIHSEDGKGGLTVVASRPPHTPGVSGSGTVCVLTFQAKAPGTTGLVFTSATYMNSTQQQVQGQGAQTTIVVK
ncbi:MAG TPA: cohesin domain-containing protein [Terracidiphilus sp.]|nr:cohesin domain-containing protein [Terracidiphilus sp.]